MRALLLASVLGLGLTVAAQSSQASVISYQVLDGSAVIGSGTSANNAGMIAIGGSDANFSVSGNAAGSPSLPSPNFSTNNFEMTFNGSVGGTITIRITETDLASYTGGIQSSFTLNSRTASSTFQSGTITNYFDAGNVAYGTSTQLGTATFTGVGSFQADRNADVVMPGLFSETTIYTLTFGAGGGSSLSSSSQLVATGVPVPEPASLTLLGAGLIGVGMIRRKRS